MNFAFEAYPFEKLRLLFSTIKPNENFSPLSFTIGEPQFDTPRFICDTLCDRAALLNKYPKSAGEDVLVEAMTGFVQKNFGITLKNSQLVSTLGTREALFNFPQFWLFGKENPTIAYPNPFYQIYEGAAKASRAKSILMPLTPENGFKPDIKAFEKLLKNGEKVHLVILNSPSNPTASVMSLEELGEWVRLALKYDFVLINDECYNQIYFGSTPPSSLLQACIATGNESFKNCFAMNSISKRSSAPGLRSGFVAGDEAVLNEYRLYRTYVGATNGLPMQLAAASAWNDEEHVGVFRASYEKNFEIAKEILGVEIPQASFYIWLNVGDGESFAAKLYETKNLQVLPGAYLGRNGVGKEFVRIALVEKPEKTREGLGRVADFLNGVNN